MVGHKLISLTSTIVPHFHTILACQQEVQTISHEDEEIWQLMLKRKAEMSVSFEKVLNSDSIVRKPKFGKQF